MKNSKLVSVIVGIFSLCLICGCGDRDNISSYQYEAGDVADLISEADKKYDSREYEEALEDYLDAMLDNPKSVAARIGAVKCEIALEEYDIAQSDLDMLIKLAPNEKEVYDLYFDLSREMDNLDIAIQAIGYAETNNMEELLAEVPDKPEISDQAGNYPDEFELSVDSDYKVIYSINNETYGMQVNSMEYSGPIHIAPGKTTVSLCAVKDGIPSKSVKATYIVDETDGIVEFADPLMEKLAKLNLGITDRQLTKSDLRGLRNLYFYKISSDEGYTYEKRKDYKLKTLDDLKYMPFLTYINMENQTDIKDFSPLAKCTFLESIQWTEGGIKNADDLLQHAKGIRYVYLQGNEIESLSGISKYKDIISLSINGNPVKDIKELKELKELYNLSIDDQYMDYDVIKELENLSGLSIYGYDFDREKIAKLDKLTNLSINEGEYEGNWEDRPMLTDLAFLEKMPQLENLNLCSVSNKSDLEYIKKLDKLRYLYIYNSPVFDEEGVFESLQQALPNCEVRK